MKTKTTGGIQNGRNSMCCTVGRNNSILPSNRLNPDYFKGDEWVHELKAMNKRLKELAVYEEIWLTTMKKEI